MTAGPCPDENALVRFSSGQLSGADHSALEQHIDGCSACRTLIVQLASLHSKTLQTPGALAPTGERVPALQGKVGRYHVERLLGGGGMGMVYAGRDRELNRVVAIKVLKTGLSAANAEPRARLLREAQTMARLSHPNLVPIFELGTDHGDDFLAMELIDGPTLDFWLREKKRTWQEIVGVFLEAGRGLEAAHQAGVVHRDFKPANVLIGPDGRPRVTDFGLARPGVPDSNENLSDSSMELTREGALLGTPAYMSPEQLEGQVADVRSDQFSFCVALAEALVGHRPYAGRTLGELRTAMRSGQPPALDVQPAALKKVLLKGMAIAPDARYPSMADLLAALRATLAPRTVRPSSIAAVAAVVALMIGATLWTRTGDPVAAAVAPPPVLQGRTVELDVGETQTVALPAVQRVGEVDASIVDVRIVGNQQVAITALKPGTTALVLLTRASPHEEQRPVTWHVVVADDGGRTFALPVGATRKLQVPGLIRIENEKQEVVNARITAKDEITVEGIVPGTSVLRTWVSGSERSLRWQITAEEVARTPLALQVGGSKELAIADLNRIAVGDSAIADVKPIGNGKVKVTAKAEGTTTLIAWTRAAPPADEGRQEWDITVSAVDQALTVQPGTQKVLTVPGVQRVAVGDASICDVKTIGSDQLLLIGGEPGVTTLLAWPKDGARRQWKVTVPAPKGAAPAIAAVPLKGVLELVTGEEKVVDVPNLQRVAVGDTSIVDVKTIGNSQLLLIGGEEGKTTMLLWKSDGTRVSTLVMVSAKSAPPPETAELITVLVGETQELAMPGIKRVRAEPGGIAVPGSRNGKLLLSGMAPGKTRVQVWKDDGTSQLFDVDVQKGEVSADELTMFIGTQKLIDLKQLQRAVAKDPKVLTVKKLSDSQLLLIGAGQGTTVLEAFTENGGRHEWNVNVHKQ